MKIPLIFFLANLTLLTYSSAMVPNEAEELPSEVTSEVAETEATDEKTFNAVPESSVATLIAGVLWVVLLRRRA